MGIMKPVVGAAWYDDLDEVVAFARWYWAPPYLSPHGVVGEIFDYFEKPWHFTEEYELWKEDVDEQ